MFELFSNMMNEEWRVHSTMFGSISFALFPVMIFGIAFMGAFLIPLMQTTLPAGELAVLTHANFLMLGFLVGAFGLLGNEVMNRRFGQASFLAYSARSLPLSEQWIFLNFVVKDIIYYFFFWVFPFGFGYIAAAPFTGGPLSRSILLLGTLTLAFLFGLCIVFFLSSVYARSHGALWLVVLFLGAVWGALTAVTGTNPALFFPPLLLYYSFSWANMLASCGVLLILFAASIILFTPEFTGTTKEYKNSFAPLLIRFSLFPNPPLSTKDMLDLYRSGSVVGQTLFSFAIPLVVIWFFLSLLNPFFPPHGLFFLFAIITGVIASTMYTWVTMFDSIGPYSCLPVAVSTLIKSKIISFSLLQIVPVVFIAGFAVFIGETAILIPAIVLCLAVSFYAVGVTVRLTGLSPNVLVYDVKVLLVYLLLIGFVLTIFTGIVFLNPRFAYASITLAVPTWWFIQSAMVKWDAVEVNGF